MKFIAFFGSIGVGKTTLGHQIKSKFTNIDFIEEYLEENIYLKKFYNNMTEYAFRSTLEMLLMMYKNYDKVDISKDITILDNGVEELICYNYFLLEKNILSLDEFKLYKQFYNLIIQSLPKIDYYIYLKCNLEEQLERIKKRNRLYEKNINREFLIELNKHYDLYLKKIPKDKLWIVDTSSPFLIEDFLENFNKKMIELNKEPD